MVTAKKKKNKLIFWKKALEQNNLEINRTKIMGCSFNGSESVDDERKRTQRSILSINFNTWVQLLEPNG